MSEQEYFDVTRDPSRIPKTAILFFGTWVLLSILGWVGAWRLGFGPWHLSSPLAAHSARSVTLAYTLNLIPWMRGHRTDVGTWPPIQEWLESNGRIDSFELLYWIPVILSLIVAFFVARSVWRQGGPQESGIYIRGSRINKKN